jgi:hypothetical protein
VVCWENNTRFHYLEDEFVTYLLKRLGDAAAFAICLAASACGDGSWNAVSGVPLAEFDTSGTPPSIIELAGPDRVVISQGEALTLSVEGDRDAGNALRFDRVGERLVIARETSMFDDTGTAIVQLRIPALSGLEVAGNGTIEADTMAPEATIAIAGSGSVIVDRIASERLGVEIAGSGNVQTSGTARSVRIEIAGSGDVNLARLQADDVRVEIAGSGAVAVASDGTVSADIAGSGDVNVFGSAECSVSSAGSGTLTCTPKSAATDAGAHAKGSR